MSRPSGSCALHVSQEQPRASHTASALPSPPSAIGTTSICASGSTSSSPFAMFCAASRALSAPLNLSGAIKMRMPILYGVSVRRREKRRFTETPYNFGRQSAMSLLFQFLLQNFSDNLRIGFAFGQLNHLSLKKVQRSNLPCSKIRYRFRVRSNHFITQRFNRASVAQFLDGFFFHN